MPKFLAEASLKFSRRSSSNSPFAAQLSVPRLSLARRLSAVARYKRRLFDRPRDVGDNLATIRD
jgi:hypothetical protein